MRWSQSRIIMPPFKRANLTNVVRPVIARGAVLFLKKIRELTLPHKKSGDLDRSWKVIAEGMDAVVYSDDPASRYLNYGTKPPNGTGVIEPRAGRASISQSRIISLKGLRGKKRRAAIAQNRLYASALKFEVAAGKLKGVVTELGETDEVIVARVKNHPGTTGIFYVKAAEDEIFPQLRLMIAEAAQAELEKALPFQGAKVSIRTGTIHYGESGRGRRFVPRLR